MPGKPFQWDLESVRAWPTVIWATLARLNSTVERRASPRKPGSRRELALTREARKHTNREVVVQPSFSVAKQDLDEQVSFRHLGLR